MNIRSVVCPIAIALAAAACSQTPRAPVDEGLGIARLKSYQSYRSSSDNRYVFSNDDSKHFMPGETMVIADLKGPGLVTHIWFTGASNEFAWPRLFRLRVYYDGRKTPSVDAPLGDFFGVGHGYEADLNSTMVYDTSLGRARNSYWPMPFRGSCRITITNEGERTKSLYYHVDWHTVASLPDGVGYFHAYYRQELPAVSGRNYQFLAIRGKGQYVGTVLNVVQTEISWFGEGDDLFYVDGATHPQIFGTGSEDYFNEAWGLRVSSGPWTGSPIAEGEKIGARLTGYRWHVPDAIPFQKSIWAGIEHRGWTYNPDGSMRTPFEERPDYFSSVAFWYQEGVNEDLPEPPYGSARLPVGNARQVPLANTLDGVIATGGKAFIQKNVDWGKDLLTLQASGPGATMTVPFDVAEAGRYELVTEMAKAPNYGNYIVLVDGQETNLDQRQPESSEIPFPGPPVYHNYEPEVYVGSSQPLGFFKLTQGRHTVTLKCVSKEVASAGYDIGIYDIVLGSLPATVGEPLPDNGVDLMPRFPEPAPAVPSGTPVFRGIPLSGYLDRLKAASPAERADVVRALGAFGDDGGGAVPQLASALGDSDPQVRAAAAWALSQTARVGAHAVPALADALGDPVAKVRVLAAVALKSIGPAAAPAVPRLAAALADAQDNMRVTAAGALGAIGPAARDAVAALAARIELTEDSRNARMAAVNALGDIGPDARSALPTLERAAATRDLGPAAREALLKVQGKPVPTWW
jgi:HEAT repeat protein